MIFRNLIISFISLTVISSCVTTNPATGKTDAFLLNEDAEFDLGHDLAREHIKKFGLYKEKEKLTNYYQGLAKELVSVTERSDKPFEFIMLDSDQFNAWATPGYINMYRGMMPFFNSEAEFMSVMAHEAGHVTARHAARSIRNQQLSQLGIIVAAGIIGSRIDDDAVATGVITAGMFASQFGFAKFGRNYEEEADNLALRYMERMGYDVREAAKMFNTMASYRDLSNKIYKYFHNGKSRPTSPFYDLLTTHPDPKIRENDSHAQAHQMKQVETKPNVRIRRDRYLDMIDGIAFGANFREYGAAGKNKIYNQKQKFVWTLPDGFYVQFIGEQWKAYDRNNKSKVDFNIIEASNDRDAEEVLRVELPEIRDLESLKINGSTAYTGTMKSGNGKKRIFGIKGDEVDDEKSDFYIISFSAKDEKLFKRLEPYFRASARSFKTISKKIANKLEPMRLKIHTVRKGETMDDLIEQMAFGDLREEWFLTLNNLERNDKLKAGQRIKLIIDPNLKLKL